MTYPDYAYIDSPLIKAFMSTTNSTPPNHQWVPTEDGSCTLFSEAFQEACHSTSGALEETLLHYIKGCQIEAKIAQQDNLSILEVGFGLGIGFLTTMDILKDQPKRWRFLSLEIDRQLLEWFRQENLEHPFLKHLVWKDNLLTAKNEQIELTILCGDARLELPKYITTHPELWDAIYQDAFSPKKNPALWSVEWFELLKKYSSDDVILSTYSASTSIRKSLLEAGWQLSKGEKFGPKKTSTRARLKGLSDPEILLHLERSPTGALRD
jgi:tRNA U34 5-methylaminomethyl-2-thiouridine-forming methyltransferase MnmC